MFLLSVCFILSPHQNFYHRGEDSQNRKSPCTDRSLTYNLCRHLWLCSHPATCESPLFLSQPNTAPASHHLTPLCCTTILQGSQGLLWFLCMCTWWGVICGGVTILRNLGRSWSTTCVSAESVWPLLPHFGSSLGPGFLCFLKSSISPVLVALDPLPYYDMQFAGLEKICWDSVGVHGKAIAGNLAATKSTPFSIMSWGLAHAHFLWVESRILPALLFVTVFIQPTKDQPVFPCRSPGLGCPVCGLACSLSRAGVHQCDLHFPLSPCPWTGILTWFIFFPSYPYRVYLSNSLGCAEVFLPSCLPSL